MTLRERFPVGEALPLTKEQTIVAVDRETQCGQLEPFNRTRQIADNVHSFQPPMPDASLRADSPQALPNVTDLGMIGIVQRMSKQLGQDFRERHPLLLAERSE
jgi:hypothetical protein